MYQRTTTRLILTVLSAVGIIFCQGSLATARGGGGGGGGHGGGAMGGGMAGGGGLGGAHAGVAGPGAGAGVAPGGGAAPGLGAPGGMNPGLATAPMSGQARAGRLAGRRGFGWLPFGYGWGYGGGYYGGYGSDFSGYDSSLEDSYKAQMELQQHDKYTREDDRRRAQMSGSSTVKNYRPSSSQNNARVVAGKQHWHWHWN